MFCIYNLQQGEKWKSAVHLFDNLDISYQPEYCQIFQGEGMGTAYLFFFEDQGEYGIYPFFLRRINDLCWFKHLQETYYDIISPYGYGGPVFSSSKDSLINGFLKSFKNYCRETNVVTEFIRFHPILENHLYLGGNDLIVEKTKPVVVLDLGQSQDEIWSDYKYSNRKNINKAKKAGLKVSFEEHPDNFTQFMEIYKETMNRRKADSFYYFSEKFFSTIHKAMKGSYIYVHVMKEGRVISSELLLFNSRYIYSFLGGTRPEYFSLRPNNLLKHEVISWAKNQGMQYFILGGGYEENDGIFQYKCTFAPKGVRDFFVGKAIHNHDAETFLNRVRNESGLVPQKAGFFPAYRNKQ